MNLSKGNTFFTVLAAMFAAAGFIFNMLTTQTYQEILARLPKQQEELVKIVQMIPSPEATASASPSAQPKFKVSATSSAIKK